MRNKTTLCSKALATLILATVTASSLTACANRSTPLSDAQSTANRPQLSASDANTYTVPAYLAQAGTIGSMVTDNWNPTAGADISKVKPDFTVDKSGALTSMQSAVVEAVRAVQSGKKSATDRQYILVKPGVYSESLFVPAGVTLTLYGETNDASKTVITQRTWAGSTQAEFQALANPENKIYMKGITPDAVFALYESCAARSGTMGTSCSAGTVVRASGFEAKNLTWANDFDESKVKTSNVQAVAMLVDSADKVIFDNVRFLGHQDTFYAKSSSVDTVNRVYLKNSYIEGDVDFIFGRSTVVLDRCVVHFVGNRVAPGSGYLIAPSTSPKHPYGFLIINSMLTADIASQQGTVALGRSWDEGRNNKDRPYEHGISPNGQAVIRDSVIGNHIDATTPWAAAASTSRPYSAAENRFTEYRNSGSAAR